MWGTNLPITRTPDAHFMTEARYRGQKVVVVSPDYSDHVKFADDWLPAQPGTDGALAMAMGHVILKEFWVERARAALRATTRKRFTDLPLLVALRGARRRARARPLPDGRRPRRGERERRLEAGAARRRDRRAGRAERRRSASATARRARAAGTCGSATSTRCSRCTAATTRRSRSLLPRFDVGDDPGGA